MVVDVITEILVARPREHVAAYAGDPSNAPGSGNQVTVTITPSAMSSIMIP